MTKQNELSAIIGWAALALIVSIYSAVMLSRSAHTIAEFRTIALKNQAAILENQKLGIANQELFKGHMKADESLARDLEEIKQLLRSRKP